MLNPAIVPPATDLAAASAAALRRVLAREQDPKARAWLRGLIDGDAPVKVKRKAKSRRKAA